MRKSNVWKTLKTAFKVLFVVIVIFWLLSLFNDFLNAHNALIERVNIQSHHIDLLQTELTQVSEQLDATNAQVAEMKVTINGMAVAPEPVVMTEDDLQREIEPQLKHTPTSAPSFLPVVVVGALQLLKTLVLPSGIFGY